MGSIPLGFITNLSFTCSGLQKYLNKQGFHIVGYGCTTCIGNSGDLDESVSSAIADNGNQHVSLSLILLIKLSSELFVLLHWSLTMILLSEGVDPFWLMKLGMLEVYCLKTKAFWSFIVKLFDLINTTSYFCQLTW